MHQGRASSHLTRRILSAASEFDLSHERNGDALRKTHLHVLQPRLDFGANFRGFFLQAWLAVFVSSLALFIGDDPKAFDVCVASGMQRCVVQQVSQQPLFVCSYTTENHFAQDLIAAR